jgi:hypothetical protein
VAETQVARKAREEVALELGDNLQEEVRDRRDRDADESPEYEERHVALALQQLDRIGWSLPCAGLVSAYGHGSRPWHPALHVSSPSVDELRVLQSGRLIQSADTCCVRDLYVNVLGSDVAFLTPVRRLDPSPVAIDSASQAGCWIDPWISLNHPFRAMPVHSATTTLDVRQINGHGPR